MNDFVRPLFIAGFALLLSCSLGALASAGEVTKLLRFPDVQGDSVVFVYAGDLWTASVTESSGGRTGRARRLTAHPGLERSPRFSPDGRWIAFTGQYDGDEQVYVIPSGGGEPRQLTFYPAQGPLPPRWGYDNQVLGWHPDGDRILLRSYRTGWALSDGSIFAVPVEGGLPRPLPLPEAGLADYSPDGGSVVYSPVFRDFRSWKRYQGGWAQELYTFDLESHELRRITDHVRADRDPMWVGNSIYFSSDRDGVFNLFAFDVDSGETRQLTRETTWDVRWPAADEAGRIVFELNGELQILDTAGGDRLALAIQVPDDGLARRPRRVPAADVMEDFAIAPGGERALFAARGDVFTAPMEHGASRNLTASPGAHDKHPEWTADGESILFISDRDGEEELYSVPADGRGAIRQLTDGGRAMRYDPRTSPDGALAAFSDKDGKLYILEIEGGTIREIGDTPLRAPIRDHTWSPDGRFLAFTMVSANGFSSVYLWSRADGRTRAVTPEEFHQQSPAWDPAGNYLYYLADREYAPLLSSWEWNFAGDRETEVFALALTGDAPHPFPPRSDEVGQKDPDEDDGDEEKAPPVSVEVDFEGLAERVARVPLPADNYDALVHADGRLLLLRSAPFYYGRDSPETTDLLAFDLKERKLGTLLEDITGFVVSRDGGRILVRRDDGFVLLEADAELDDDAEPRTVPTDGLQVDRVPEAEWAQIFDEVWRRFRDFFYVENLHGYDWQALRDRYRPLLTHVGHRDDLNYLLGEMIAELSVSHAYVAGGDQEIPERPSVALLGARLELDEAAGRYRIAEIYPGQNQEERYRSPLTEIGVDARPGDYLLAIDGQDLAGSDNPYRLLRFKADRPVTLTLAPGPFPEGAREVTVRPIASEVDLRYLSLVQRRRQMVTELSDGRLGYVHVPDMGPNGLQQFIKTYYGQIDKEGLVMDVRNNGGGNVSAMLIERLGREVLAFSYSRTWDLPTPYPTRTFQGPMACLLDEDSASDGDIFPHMFRQAGLGPLIGKRSWGGVIGITNRGTLMDGGSVSVPEFGFLSPEGEWIIEGHGVEPDIEVENDPASVLAGRDPQLERAVQEVLQRLEGTGKRWTKRPAGPVKTQESLN